MSEQNASPNETEGSNSITLNRSQNGTYGWEIKLRWPIGAAADQTLTDMESIDMRLKSTYPTAGGE